MTTSPPSLSHTKPCTHPVHVPAQLAIGIANISKCVVVVAGETRGTEKDKGVITCYSWRSEKCGTAMARTRDEEKLHWNPFSVEGMQPF